MKTLQQDNRNIMSTMTKGLLIGGTMLVPGVSGGSMAMILGIYDKLISSISSFRKHKLESALFLLLFMVGGCLGMFLFSKPLLHLIEMYPMPTLYFFMGAVLGGTPLIVKQAGAKIVSLRSIVCIIAGIAAVILVSLIPVEEVMIDEGSSSTGSVFLIFAGLAAAVALVLPGISISYLLLMIGLYDETMRAISQLYMPYLVPLGIGLLIGIILATKLLEKVMTAFPEITYLIILGFVLGSLAEVFPGIPAGYEIPLSIFTFAAGCGSILLLSKKEAAETVEEDASKTE